MDSIDKKIKQVLSENLIEPLGYDNRIKEALYNKKIKQVKFSMKIFKTVCTACACIILTTGIVFASYTIYEKVWKEPTKFNSYEEYQNNMNSEKNNEEASRTIELEQAEKNGEIISEDQVIICANEILKTLGYNITITNENIRYDDIDSKHSYNLYYVIRTNNNVNSGIELKLGANGKIYSFTNRDIAINYNINPDQIDKEKAIDISNNILNKLGLKNLYTLNSADINSHFFNGKEKQEWWVTYVKNYNGILNKYETIELDFYLENNEIKIEQILTKTTDYEIEKNKICITESEAIEIAKKKDRTISELEIKNIETSLEFRPLNAFTYLQEQSNGKDDGLTSEIQESNKNIVYNKYNVDSKILRKVYNVKINYVDIFTNSKQAHNWKEQFGREYYVDVTTGEIIGGQWGNTLY